MTAGDAGAVLTIYKIGMDEGNATFETEVPTWERFDAGHLPACSHVAVDDRDEVLGWVAASPVSTRACYAGVIEHSVYVHPDARGQRIGRLLLDRLIEASEAVGAWTIQSSIFPENHASLALHAAAGFRTIGTRERIAQHHGRWRDTLLIERRRSNP
jgi:L-amino acid N-acyltransferase YncA